MNNDKDNNHLSRVMAIVLKVKNPESIIEGIKREIDNEIIETWSYDSDGDFTHTGQWRNKAWFSTISEKDSLTFIIIGRKNVKMELSEYAIYHGRFVELLINHFSKEITSIKITTPFEHPLDCDSINM